MVTPPWLIFLDHVMESPLSVWSVKGQLECLHPSIELSPNFNQGNHSMIYFLHMEVSVRAVSSISYIHDVLCHFLKENLMQKHCSFIRKCISHLKCTTIHSRWEAMQRVMAKRFTKMSETIVILWHLVAESCTTCHSQAYRWVTIFWIYLCKWLKSVWYNLSWLRHFTDLLCPSI